MNEIDREVDGVSVSADGVTVHKSYEEDEFPVPAIAFRIESGRDDPVRVRLVDHIPDEVPMDDLGFHPEYGSDHWSVEEHRITFERELAPDEECVTVYGIRVDDAEEVEAFLDEPELELDEIAVEAEATAAPGGEPGTDDGDLVSEAEEIVSRESSQVVRDVISGEAETVPGLGGDDEPAGAEAAGRPDEVSADRPGDEPGDEEAPGIDHSGVSTEDSSGAPDSDADEDGDEDEDITPRSDDPDLAVSSPADEHGVGQAESGGDGAPGPQPTVGDTESVAAALAAEFRNGRVSEDDIEPLREAFGETSASTDARIKYLQSEVADLAAYKDALEEFIDENGPGHRLVEDARSEMDRIEDRMDRLEEQTTGQGDDIAEIGDDVHDLEDDLDDIESDVGELRDEIDSRVEEIETDLEERVADIETELEDDIGRRVEKLEDGLDERIDDLQAEVETLQEDIEELTEWRERLGAVADILGGGGGDIGAGTGAEEGDNEDPQD